MTTKEREILQDVAYNIVKENVSVVSDEDRYTHEEAGDHLSTIHLYDGTTLRKIQRAVGELNSQGFRTDVTINSRRSNIKISLKDDE